jgi:hypothetical protein
MGVYKRGEPWDISCFHNGKRIRKTIRGNKKQAEAELEAIRVDIRGGRYKGPRRDSFDSLVEEYERLQNRRYPGSAIRSGAGRL